MDADQFRDALNDLKISQRRFAAIWGTTPVSVSRWLLGLYPFPGWVEPAIMSMRASNWWLNTTGRRLRRKSSRDASAINGG